MTIARAHCDRMNANQSGYCSCIGLNNSLIVVSDEKWCMFYVLRYEFAQVSNFRSLQKLIV